MKKTAAPPRLTLVEPGLTGSQPSRPLGAHGQALWRKTTTEYRIEDAAGVEMLTQACQALDRAEGLADRIAEDGDNIRTPTRIYGPPGMRAPPGIRGELAARGFVVRTLQKLG